MVVVGKWRRLDGYYARTDWAGKLRLGDQWVLDGPLNNPLIHYVHQALLVACPQEHMTLRPLTAQAELYRAHPIEGEDIVCARAELEGGIMLHTYLTLCAPEESAATIEIVGEKGRAWWRRGQYRIDSETGRKEFSKETGLRGPLFYNLVAALRGEQPLWSPLSSTRNVILHNNGCFASAGRIRPIPHDKVRRYRDEAKDEVATEVERLPELVDEAAAERRMFSQMEVPWARSTPMVQLDFDEFDPSPLLSA